MPSLYPVTSFPKTITWTIGPGGTGCHPLIFVCVDVNVVLTARTPELPKSTARFMHSGHL